MQCGLLVGYRDLSWTARLLKMGPVGCSEMSVTAKLCCITSQRSEDLKNLSPFGTQDFPLVDYWETSHELWGSVKGWELLDKLTGSQLL